MVKRTAADVIVGATNVGDTVNVPSRTNTTLSTAATSTEHASANNPIPTGTGIKDFTTTTTTTTTTAAILSSAARAQAAARVQHVAAKQHHQRMYRISVHQLPCSFFNLCANLCQTDLGELEGSEHQSANPFSIFYVGHKLILLYITLLQFIYCFFFFCLFFFLLFFLRHTDRVV